ncbi:MAG TPA: hypothetical protein VKK79_18095 [Candidatus Lokiarchaeia archaeon]|nr:hypothetical protein [Candidatus Lokiarchaeia archaeon]
MKKLVDVEIILKATPVADGDQFLMHDLMKYYNRHFPRIGIDMYLEKTLDGMLMFYSTFEDFFSSYYIPSVCSQNLCRGHQQDVSPSEGPVEWKIQAEKLPKGRTFEDLMRTVQKFYEHFVPGSTLNVLNDREAILTFPHPHSFELWLNTIQECLQTEESSLYSN